MGLLKVLQFIPSLNKYDGGTTTYMQQLSFVLGQEVELHVCALIPVAEFAEIKNCIPHSIPLSLFHMGKMKQAWVSLLEEIQPDVVHFNCCWMPQIAAVIHWTKAWRERAQKERQQTGRFEVRLFLTPHGMLEPWILSRNYWTKKLPAIVMYQRRALKEVDCIVATSNEEKQHLMDLGWNRNIALVRNGILVEEIIPKREWHNCRRLLFMSRIHPKKGLEMLFEAMRSLRNEGLFITLKIAGEGAQEYVTKLHALAPEGVTFMGPVYGDEKWNLIREADAVILPSYSENYGLIVAEALSSSTPVIVTKGAPWSCIEKYNAGWWIRPSVDDLTMALRKFANTTDEELMQLGHNARQLAEHECSVSQTCKLLKELYQNNAI